MKILGMVFLTVALILSVFVGSGMSQTDTAEANIWGNSSEYE